MKLARELGISQALVSLTLNGRRQNVHAATHDRIWALALQRGYSPKGMQLAASPVAPPGQVGVIIQAPLRLNTPSHYFGHVQHGLHSALQQQGSASVFLGAEDQLDLATLQRAFAAGHSFRSLVVLGEVSRRFLERLRQFGLPIVTVSARHPGFCHSVLPDDRQALESLVKHLHGNGHRRFGWIGGNVGLGRHDARLRAFESALNECDLELPSRYCLQLAAADRAEGAEAVYLLKPHFPRRDFPTAFISYNTLMAAGAIRAFQREGRWVPRDLSIASAGFSNTALPQMPPITAAGSNPEKLGEAAARILASLLTQNAAEGRFAELVVPAQFSLGDTTGVPPRDLRTLRSRESGWIKTLAA